MKTVLIFDLDNTIYSVKSIGEKLFNPLFNLIKSSGELNREEFKRVKEEVMKRPFQKVAHEYKLSHNLAQKGKELLKELTCDDLQMKPVADYETIKDIPADKFLVTIGFTNMQRSKIKRLGIENDFKQIFIIDPEKTQKTKKDIFSQIITKYQYKIENVLVIGDDPESEIFAANELNLDTFLLDPKNIFQHIPASYRSHRLKDVKSLLK